MKTVTTGGFGARARLSNTPSRARITDAKISVLEKAVKNLTDRVIELEKNPKVVYVNYDSGACE